MLRNGLIVLLGWAICPIVVGAAPPADQILPATTKGFLSVPHVEDLQTRWRRTQLGTLAVDPVMKPFADSLRQQVRERMINGRFHIELEWSDVLAVCGGELAVATIQPNENGVLGHATVLYVDVTGKREAAVELLADAARQLAEKGATKQTKQVAGTEVTIHTLPRQRGEAEAARVIRVLTDDALVLGNHEAICLDVVRRLSSADEQDQGTLSTVDAYRTVMSRVKEASGSDSPQVRWYLEPFNYADVIRASRTTPARRGTDMLAILKGQGFEAVEAVGGWIHVSTETMELLHRTFVYAPGNPEADERFRLAARILDFPNDTKFVWPDWVPRDLAAAVSFRWNVRDAFEYSKTLVDAIANDPSFFEDLLSSIRDDPNGPQIDVRKGLVAFLEKEVTVISDYVLPVTPQSERLLVAIRVSNPKAVAETIHKALVTDPYAKRLEVEGQTVWEIAEEDDGGVPNLNLQIPGAAPAAPPAKEPLPNSAVTVANGHFIVATHVDFLRRILQERPAEDRLSLSEDVKMVDSYLNQVGAGSDSLRFFSRTDESYRPTYEMIRAGRMPESESMLGKLLNRVLGPDDEDVLREQTIDGSTLPEYQAVRRYLGPSGAFVRTEEDGWMATGILLDKKAPFANAEAETDPTLTEASGDASSAASEQGLP